MQRKAAMNTHETYLNQLFPLESCYGFANPNWTFVIYLSWLCVTISFVRELRDIKLGPLCCSTLTVSINAISSAMLTNVLSLIWHLLWHHTFTFNKLQRYNYYHEINLILSISLNLYLSIAKKAHIIRADLNTDYRFQRSIFDRMFAIRP